MLFVKNGISDFEEMSLSDFLHWIRALSKSLFPHFSLYITVDIVKPSK